MMPALLIVVVNDGEVVIDSKRWFIIFTNASQSFELELIVVLNDDCHCLGAVDDLFE